MKICPTPNRKKNVIIKGNRLKLLRGGVVVYSGNHAKECTLHKHQLQLHCSRKSSRYNANALCC